MKNITSLNQLARILTPAAMVVFLTMEIVNSQHGIGVWVYPVAIAALFTSIGIEAWGMMSGSNVEKAWITNRSKWASGIQLFLYVVVTMWLLRNNATLITLPIVASLVYVSAALYESLNKHEEAMAKETRQSLMIQLRKEEEQAKRDHELKLEKMRLDADVKKEKIHAQATPQLAPQPRKVAVTVDTLTPGQQRVYDAIKSNPGASNSEIGSMLGISRQAVQGHIKAMNGVMHEVKL